MCFSGQHFYIYPAYPPAPTMEEMRQGEQGMRKYTAEESTCCSHEAERSHQNTGSSDMPCLRVIPSQFTPGYFSSMIELNN